MKMTAVLIGTACLMTTACKPVINIVKGDKEDLQGNWIVVSGDTAGYLPWLEDAVKGGRLVFAGDEAIFMNGHETRGTYKIDPDAKPKAIDMTGDQNETWKAIYIIDGDTLKLCIGSNSRPTEFVAKPGREGQALLVLRRGKKP